MGIRFALSTLSTSEARQSAGRWLLFLCAVGYVVTLWVLFILGRGLGGWLFTLLIWVLIIYIPLRILLEAFQSIAPRIRGGLVTQTAGRADRYATRPSISLLVEAMLQREVVMPRIATPLQRVKAHDGAVAILARLGSQGLDDHREAIRRCLTMIDRWIIDLASAARSSAPPPIQARWADLRALISLAASTKILLAAYEDRAGRACVIPGLADRQAGAYLDTCLDYCDELALEVDPDPWTELPLGFSLESATLETLLHTWMAFASTEPPALEARAAFLQEFFPQTTVVR